MIGKNATKCNKQGYLLCCTTNGECNKSNIVQQKKEHVCCTINVNNSIRYTPMQQMQQKITKKSIDKNIYVIFRYLSRPTRARARNTTYKSFQKSLLHLLHCCMAGFCE